MESVFLHIVRMSVIASILALVVILLRFLLKRTPRAIICVLWGFVAVRLIFPISLETSFSLIPNQASMLSEVMTPSASDAPNRSNHVINTTEPLTPSELSSVSNMEEAVSSVIVSPTETITQTIAPNSNTGSVSAESGTPTSHETTSRIAFLLWPTGIIAMLLYASSSYLRIHKKVREAVPLSGNIWLCDHVTSPFILGIFRPRILLPSDMEPSEMRNVIAHERAHLKRLDHFWKPLGFVLLSVYWFNPILWIAYILLCRDIELACDERVVKEMNTEEIKSYSSTLLNYSISRKAISICPLAFGEVNVKKRIKNVLNYKKPAFWITLASLAICAVVAVCFLTNPKQTPKQNPKQDTKEIAENATPLDNETLLSLVDEIIDGTEHTYNFMSLVEAKRPQYELLLSGGDATVNCFVQELERTEEYGLPEYLMALACSEITGIGLEEGEYDPRIWWATGKDWLELYQRTMRNADSKTYVNELLSVSFLNHYYNQSAPENRTIELTPYFDIPGLSLMITETDITHITPEGNKTILSYAQIWNGFFYDLNRDFSPELCVTVTTDSALADTRVAVYDFAAGQLYELKDPGTYDYSLFYDSSRFFVYQTGYGNGNTVSHGTLTLAQTETGDFVLQIGPAPKEEYDYLTKHYNELPVYYLNLVDYCTLYSSQAHGMAYYSNYEERTRLLERLTYRFDTLEQAEKFLSKFNDCVCWVDGGITTIGEQDVIKPYDFYYSHDPNSDTRFHAYGVVFYPTVLSTITAKED